MRSPGEDWYRGTADAIYQNINLIEQADPHFVVIFGADHIYRMNIREMLEFHMHKRAQVTVAAIPGGEGAGQRVRRDRDRPDGALSVSRKESPTRPPCRAIRSACTRRWATTFSRPTCCCGKLYADAQNPDSSHDFGRDILPSLVGRAAMFAYDFQTNRIPGDPPQEPYWRDVGTIDAYYDANMDLRAVTPALNLYNRQWPLRTAGYSDAPAKFIFDEKGRRGQAIDSIVPAAHSIRRHGARLVLGRGVRVHSGRWSRIR
jgi:glucose-1-phosphate adenylyltransferase